MILLLGGTSESREIAEALRFQGYDFWVSVASEFAKYFLDEEIPLRYGCFSEKSLEDFVIERRIQVIIDATHPFALDIKRIALRVAQRRHLLYLRYERETRVDSENLVRVQTFEEAVGHLAPYQQVFLTVGSKSLSPFLRLKEEGKRFKVRVLPTSSSLEECERLGLTPQEIVALCGPFTTAMNRLLFAEFGAEVVVSKESGKEGGLLEKIEATSSLGIPLLVVARPGWAEELVVVKSVAELLARLANSCGAC